MFRDFLRRFADLLSGVLKFIETILPFNNRKNVGLLFYGPLTRNSPNYLE